MDKAKINLGHGQRLDTLCTKFGQTTDKDWTLRPEFVRPTILQECLIAPLTLTLSYDASGIYYARSIRWIWKVGPLFWWVRPTEATELTDVLSVLFFIVPR